ncbi:AbfB domain-containing protein [Streptomyces sp. NPDC090106]|uniref:AbfB domain-containing protein n=1 Tax=Streptomyces sp. NPDC090106 TaxID=3365946 RepID=UPI0038138D63
MPENQSRLPQPWENGWVPDTSRAPGTRRLYLAGALAVATVVTCAAAVALTDRRPAPSAQPAAEDSTSPGLISYATPSPGTTTAPPNKTGLTRPKKDTASASANEEQHSSAAPAPTAGQTATKSPSSPAGSPTPKTPSTTWRSVRAVNYPDRYWHVSGGSVKLDPLRGSESREDSTFKLVKGLADSSCYSFATHDGEYLRHRNFVLVADRDDGSALFEKDATFCPRASSFSGAVMLEAVNYPGRYLRHQNFQLRLDPYQNGGTYRADSAFRLVDGVA